MGANEGFRVLLETTARYLQETKQRDVYLEVQKAMSN